MSDAAEVQNIEREVVTRRFEVADLTKHGKWLMERLRPKFPEVPEQFIGGYLMSLLSNNEVLFLYQDHAVALVQVIHSPGLRPVKLVQEHFVWVENKNDKTQVEDAAQLYDHILLWAKQHGAVRINADEDSDVTKKLIEEKLGRLFDTKISYARIK